MNRPSILARLIAAALVTAAAAGCASTPADFATERLYAQIRARGVDPKDVIVPFELNDEMREWVRHRVPAGGESETQLEQLLKAMLNRDGKELKYEHGVTGTARDVWQTSRANCLSFSHTYIGLARELGLQVYYLRVYDLESFEKAGDLVIASDHVTAAYGPANRRRVLDFVDRPIPDYHTVEPMSDLTALALHYSNRGAENIREGQLKEAEAMLRLSVKLDDTLGDGWVNLGVALRRLGQGKEAEAAFRRALETNPRLLPAYSNLAALLERQGRNDEARRLLELTDRRRNRNPFTYLALGDLAMEEGRLGDAERFFRHAQRLHPDRAEPLAALGQWALAAGKCRDAQRWLERAEKLDPNNARTGEFGRSLRAGASRCPRQALTNALR
jgi:tetratricopeptide (TPR) repeat protein